MEVKDKAFNVSATLLEREKENKIRAMVNEIINALVDSVFGVEVTNEVKVQGLRDEFKKLIDAIRQEIAMMPTLDGVQETINNLARVMESKEFNPTIHPPKIDLEIPEIKIPEIRIPDIKLPDIKFPATKGVKVDISKLEKLFDAHHKKIAVLLKQLKASSSKQITAFSQSSGISKDEMDEVIGIPETGGHLKATVTTGGTPVQVSSTSIPCVDVYLSADTDAGKVLVVGFDNSVDASTGNKNGMILIPGNDVVKITTNDLKNLWVDSDGDGGVLCVTYTKRS